MTDRPRLTLAPESAARRRRATYQRPNAKPLMTLDQRGRLREHVAAALGVIAGMSAMTLALIAILALDGAA